jgi:hypothetical protein
MDTRPNKGLHSFRSAMSCYAERFLSWDLGELHDVGDHGVGSYTIEFRVGA